MASAFDFIEGTESTDPSLGKLTLRIQKESFCLFKDPNTKHHYNHSNFVFFSIPYTFIENLDQEHHQLIHSLEICTILTNKITSFLIFHNCSLRAHRRLFVSNSAKAYHQQSITASKIHTKMQIQSILFMLAAASTPIFALPIVLEHTDLGLKSVELHNIHQESCQQLSQTIQAMVDHAKSQSCDAQCKTESNKTLAILRSTLNEFPC